MAARDPGQRGEPFDGEVVLRRQLFRSPDEAFAVLLAEDGEGATLTAAGPLAHLSPGDRVRLVGSWEEHARYGRQVRAEAGYVLDPDDAQSVRKYLTTIRHIGKHRARLLADRYPLGLFEAIDGDPEAVFRSLPGVGGRGARQAAESWRERRALRDLYLLLAPHGAGWLARTLRERHGAAAAALVRQDPYRLTEEHGIGFATADAIARAHGVPADAPGRLRAAALHVLGRAEARGHTYLPLTELRRAAASLVGELPLATLEGLHADGRIVLDGDRGALASTWHAERRSGEALARLIAAGPAFRTRLPRHPDPGLSEEQSRAVEAAFARRLSLVTGGPGTGKTTLVRSIVALAARAKRDVALCAPTGRAARRLEEATGHAATTIHRLVEWLPGEGPARGAAHPLECDLLVVDESSMLSLGVATMLLDAVGDRTHVVLIGDADQLPPVGAGKPFADLIESGRAPHARLTHVFRQAARSLIVQAAHAINRGEPPSTRPGEDGLRDFFFLPVEAASDAADLVVELASKRLARHYGVDPIRELQVLAPIYAGPLGVDSLNGRLRALLNADGNECLEGAVREGDKLIQTRNDYETGLMNGQIVIAVGEDGEGEKLVVEADDGRTVAIAAERARWLRPAYAISVHKSQGCEMPVVVVPVHASHGALLSRNLLYTAVTRAKRVCVVVGQRHALRRAVARVEASGRYTRLAELLAESS
ncbi:MAG: AAA family ATPase [Solirubrobacterales bacterium]|nr:AAA family ATPase [Solirubrobacterales bacterium]